MAHTVSPAFASEVKPGDIVAGGLFYRNAINLALPAVVCASAKHIRDGDQLGVDLEHGKVKNRTTGEALDCEPMPAFLMALIRDGGLLPHLEKKLARKA